MSPPDHSEHAKSSDASQEEASDVETTDPVHSSSGQQRNSEEHVYAEGDTDDATSRKKAHDDEEAGKENEAFHPVIISPREPPERSVQTIKSVSDLPDAEGKEADNKTPILLPPREPPTCLEQEKTEFMKKKPVVFPPREPPETLGRLPEQPETQQAMPPAASNVPVLERSSDDEIIPSAQEVLPSQIATPPLLATLVPLDTLVLTADPEDQTMLEPEPKLSDTNLSSFSKFAKRCVALIVLAVAVVSTTILIMVRRNPRLPPVTAVAVPTEQETGTPAPGTLATTIPLTENPGAESGTLTNAAPETEAPAKVEPVTEAQATEALSTGTTMAQVSTTVPAASTAVTTAPETAATTASAFASSMRLQAILPVLTNVSSLESLTKANSPQNRALRWIAHNDIARVPVNDQTRLIQRYILAVLYFATRGETWSHGLNFLSETHECSWKAHVTWTKGVARCTGNRVTNIFLPDNGLNGTIPSELFRIETLTTLALNQNMLSGDFPSNITRLTALQSLSLGSNNLFGSIPSNIDKLSRLTDLYLFFNQLSGPIPEKVGRLTDLTELDVSGNRLSGSIPSEVGKLTQLTYLSLWGNILSGSIPAQIGLLTNLMTLDFSQNLLSGPIPSETRFLSQVSWLNMFNNRLSGSIPTEIGRMTSLEMLGLAKNNLVGLIPTEMGGLSLLTALHIAINLLNGPIPSQVGSLTAMEIFSAHNNSLSGTIPTNIGSMKTLEALQLYYNTLDGPLPSEIGFLTSLKALRLHFNQVTGTVPLTLTKLKALVNITLHSTNVVGDVAFLCDAIGENFGRPESIFTVDMDKVNCSCCNCCE